MKKFLGKLVDMFANAFVPSDFDKWPEEQQRAYLNAQYWNY